MHRRGEILFSYKRRRDVEPCAFVHFAADNIKGKSLKQILSSPLFAAFQKRQPFSQNFLRPCPLIDVPNALRQIVAESGAAGTHEGAEAILYGDPGNKIDEIADAWKAEADNIWHDIENKEESKEEAVS